MKHFRMDGDIVVYVIAPGLKFEAIVVRRRRWEGPRLEQPENTNTMSLSVIDRLVLFLTLVRLINMMFRNKSGGGVSLRLMTFLLSL